MISFSESGNQAPETPPGDAATWWRNPYFLCAAAIVTASLAVRTLAIFNDFWVDEIKSWFFVRTVSSPLDIFTLFLDDNNHPLNTLFIWLMGNRLHEEFYRLFSLVSGTAAVGLMGFIAGRYGRAAGLTALVLGGFSSLFVLYSSEARGYAPAVLCALLALLMTKRCLEGGGWPARFLFWIVVALGLLSHASFVFAYLGTLAWSVARLVRWRRVPKLKPVVTFLAMHLVPLFFMFLFGWWLSRLTVSGGPRYTVSGVLRETAAYTFGVPSPGRWAAVLGVAVLMAFLVEMVIMAGKRSDEWTFFLTTAILAPATALLIIKPEVLFPRYFLVSTAVLLIPLSRFLGWWWGLGRVGKAGLAAIMIIFLAGNAGHIAVLLRHGRGHYKEALRYMAEHTMGDTVTVGGDQDMRDGMTVFFHAQRLPGGKKFIYLSEAVNNPGVKPEWLIMQNSDNYPLPGFGPVFRIPGGGTYVLKENYPFAWQSGLRWFVYRRYP